MKQRKFGRTAPSNAPDRTPPPGADAASPDAIVVFTADRREDLLAKRGSGDWVLNPDKASRCRYLVCCRKPRWDNRTDLINGRAAFLVGTIKTLAKAPGPANVRNQHRYFIEISDYALVESANAWDPSWRNPVAYASLPALGLDPKALNFKPIDTAPQPTSADIAAPGRLTIAEAKKALAESFGVRPEDIEINIRG